MKREKVGEDFARTSLFSNFRFHTEDEQELIFSSSGDEISNFEGFDIDEMPLSFIARGNEQRESDSDQDMDDFLDESSDEDDSASDEDDSASSQLMRSLKTGAGFLLLKQRLHLKSALVPLETCHQIRKLLISFNCILPNGCTA